MKFVRVIKGYEHLWAVKEPDKEHDELTSLFEKWNNADYLLDFFIDNIEDLKNNFHVEKVSEAIQDTFEDANIYIIFGFFSTVIGSVCFLGEGIQPPSIILFIHNTINFLFILSDLLVLEKLFSKIRCSY